MEVTQEDLVLLYLHEMGSFDLHDSNEVPPSITKEAISIKCGLKREELERFVSENKFHIRQRNAKIKRRRHPADCLFLTSKGVLKAKSVLERVKDTRIEYVDDTGKQRIMKLKEVYEELRSFGIGIDFFDTYMRGKRAGRIALSEFTEPVNWIKDTFRDHAFPEMIVISNTSCMPFGAVFIAFGESGLIIPINKKIEIGIHPFGSGDVIRWMKRRDGGIEDAYYIDGKKGFQALTSGHSRIKGYYDLYKDLDIFKDEKDFADHFDVLTRYDYSLIFSSGAGYGISMAGQLGTILAALSIHLKDGVQFPFNCPGKDGPSHRHLGEGKVPVWDFPMADEPRSISDMLLEGASNDQEGKGHSLNLMRKFITLSQVFERHWNSSFSLEELEEVKGFQGQFGLREFSSGGACLSSVFASPVLTNLDEEGRVSMDSMVFPELPVNKNLGLIIDRKGGIDDPMSGFRETFKRFLPLIKVHGQKVLRYFSRLKSTSGELANLSAAVMLENHRFADEDAALERRAICDLLQMQKGIYGSLGMENSGFEILDRAVRGARIDMVVSPIGVGNSGTYFFCVPDQESLHSLKKVVDQLNLSRGQNEVLEVVTHGSSHRYIFNTDPLVVIRK